MLGSKWRLRLHSSGTEITFGQTKRSTFELTTANEYLFVYFELNTLPSLIYVSFLVFSHCGYFITQETIGGQVNAKR